MYQLFNQIYLHEYLPHYKIRKSFDDNSQGGPDKSKSGPPLLRYGDDDLLKRTIQMNLMKVNASYDQQDIIYRKNLNKKLEKILKIFIQTPGLKKFPFSPQLYQQAL